MKMVDNRKKSKSELSRMQLCDVLALWSCQTTALSLNYLTCKTEILTSTGLLCLNNKIGRRNSVDASFRSSSDQHLMSTYIKVGITENICRIYRRIMVSTWR